MSTVQMVHLACQSVHAHDTNPVVSSSVWREPAISRERPRDALCTIVVSSGTDSVNAGVGPASATRAHISVKLALGLAAQVPVIIIKYPIASDHDPSLPGWCLLLRQLKSLSTHLDGCR